MNPNDLASDTRCRCGHLMTDHPVLEDECPCKFCPCVLDIWEVVERQDLTLKQFEAMTRKMKGSS